MQRRAGAAQPNIEASVLYSYILSSLDSRRPEPYLRTKTSSDPSIATHDSCKNAPQRPELLGMRMLRNFHHCYDRDADAPQFSPSFRTETSMIVVPTDPCRSTDQFRSWLLPAPKHLIRFGLQGSQIGMWKSYQY